MKNIDSFPLNPSDRNFDAFARFKKNEEPTAARNDKKSKKKKEKRTKSPEFREILSANPSAEILEMQQVENLIRQAQAQSPSGSAYDDKIFALLQSVPEIEAITLEVLDEFHGGRFDDPASRDSARIQTPPARKTATVQKIRFERVD